MKDLQQFQPTRRLLFALCPALGAAALSAIPLLAFSQEEKKGEKNEKREEVSTNEDLMREHGILKRVLLAYQEIVRRIRAKEDFSAQSVIDGATIIRKFIEVASGYWRWVFVFKAILTSLVSADLPRSVFPPQMGPFAGAVEIVCGTFTRPINTWQGEERLGRRKEAGQSGSLSGAPIAR